MRVSLVPGDQPVEYDVYVDGKVAGAVTLFYGDDDSPTWIADDLDGHRVPCPAHSQGRWPTKEQARDAVAELTAGGASDRLPA